MANRRPLVFVEFEGGCFVPLSHKLNPDGYFRKRFTGASGDDICEMFHRFIYRAHNGEIPEGYEVDHICRNRACSNPQHLQVLDRTTHLVKTNSERYKARRLKAEALWQETACTGTALSQHFNVTPSAACRWIRGWKAETP